MPMCQCYRIVIIVFLHFIAAVNSITAQDSTAIHFFKGTWNEVLAEAAARRLPIFVDVYTDWCAPCKQMEREVFVKPEVGTFFNRHFISYRMNAEKGEGPRLGKTYEVKAYPTWLFLDKTGTLLSRRTGYLSAPEFIATAGSALGMDSVAANLAAFETRFRNGDRDIDFLRAYLSYRTSLQLDNSSLLNTYVSVLRNAVPDSTELWFLAKNGGRSWSEAVPFISKHLDKLPSTDKSTLASLLFDRTVYFAWGTAINDKDSLQANRIRRIALSLYPLLNDARQLTFNHLELYHGRKLGQVGEMKKAAYRLAGTQMDIDTLFAQKKDRELFEKIQHVFEREPTDSVLKNAFAEEKRLAMKQYSAQVATLLYECADAFSTMLSLGDPALKDAALWAERAYQLHPTPATALLARKLDNQK